MSEIKRRNKNNRKRGSKFEKVTADYLGMEVVPYSGSNDRFGYGDVKHPYWLGECKNISLTVRAMGDMIIIKQEWIDDIMRRAKDVTKLPFVSFMAATRSEKFIILPYEYINSYMSPKQKVLSLELEIHESTVVNWCLKYDSIVKYIKIGTIGLVIKTGRIDDIIDDKNRIFIMRIETLKDVIMPYVHDKH